MLGIGPHSIFILFFVIFHFSFRCHYRICYFLLVAIIIFGNKNHTAADVTYQHFCWSNDTDAELLLFSQAQHT